MKTTVKYYRQLLDQTAGDNVTKIKTLIESQMDQWYLIDNDLVIDLLDDKNIDAEDLLEALKGVAEFDSENTAFKNAVVAIELTLHAKPRQKDQKAQKEDLSDILDDADLHGNDSVIAFYSEVDGFDDDMRLAG